MADNPAEAVSFVRSDEQSMLASTLRDMLSETVDLDAVREMSTTDSAFDAALWSALTDMGVVGLHIPEADGGAGMSLADVAVVAEQLGRVVGAVPFLSSVVASSAVRATGDEAQRGRHLPPACGFRISARRYRGRWHISHPGHRRLAAVGDQALRHRCHIGFEVRGGR